MKILITGFDPFGGESINPAYEAVKLLPDSIGECEIIKLEVPTVFGKAFDTVEMAVEEHSPDAVICVGQAGGRTGITLERVAINLIDARIPDNEGNQPIDQPIIQGGANAYFAQLPVKVMVNSMLDCGIQASVSYTAGTFVCNELMYRLLNLIDKKYPEMRGGFIHVPYLPEQVTNLPDGTPSMSAEDIARGLESAIKSFNHEH